MTEKSPDSSQALDPTFKAGNVETNPELDERVGRVVEFFQQEFDLKIDSLGKLEEEPTAEQLAKLKEWHEATSSKGGIIMPDIDTFTAKVILAGALMPQRDEGGEIQYLFGKGVGVELALQGEVEGRDKHDGEVPYRTHSDFEIYGVSKDSYDAIPNSERFTAVFGSQEIYPATQTKGLKELPETYMHETAEIVHYGGVEFVVPNLELQFVDKFEKANAEIERKLRGQTDAEWLASTYTLDADLIHMTVDNYVITPELNKLEDPPVVALRNRATLEKKFAQVKRRLRVTDMPNATDAELSAVALEDQVVTQFGINIGLSDVAHLFDTESGQLSNNSLEQLTKIETQRQEKVFAGLHAKYEEISSIIGE